MSHLTDSRFRPARGGHAPGDLRQAFTDAVDAFMHLGDHEPQPVVEFRGKRVSLDQLAGLLWNCTDIMPSTLRGDIGTLAEQVTDQDEGEWRHGGHTYAQGARLVRLYMRVQGMSLVA